MHDRLLACCAESTACRPNKANSLSRGQANSLSYTNAEAFERGLIKSHAQNYPYKNDRSNRRIFFFHLIVTNSVLVHSSGRGSGSGNRRLAHVGWHSGSKHGLEYERLADILGP